jgi:hypothetical protein
MDGDVHAGSLKFKLSTRKNRKAAVLELPESGDVGSDRQGLELFGEGTGFESCGNFVWLLQDLAFH